jgi:hypothetical protein
MCCVCQQYIEHGSHTITTADRSLILLVKNVFVPDGARCCSTHVYNGKLCINAIHKISSSSIQLKKFISNDIQCLISEWQTYFQNQKRFDFDDPRSFSDEEFKTLTGLMKKDFDDLLDQISLSGIRNTTNRSIRTALAILLCKLRLGLSNSLLAIMFQLPNKRTVSRSLESIRLALMARFVRNNLGFHHITRDEIINRHTSTIAKALLCDDEPDTAVVVVDGTYIYIQVSYNRSFVLIVKGKLFFCRNLATTNSKGNRLICIKNGPY